jgi:hypothetical protein
MNQVCRIIGAPYFSFPRYLDKVAPHLSAGSSYLLSGRVLGNRRARVCGHGGLPLLSWECVNPYKGVYFFLIWPLALA